MFKNSLCSCKSLVSITRRNLSKDHYKLVIVGGGSGGLATASKFKRALGAENIAIVEPADIHYYQPGWTLVGSGLKEFDKLKRNEADLIPKGCQWFKTKAKEFNPDKNSITLDNQQTIKYDYLIVAVGIEANFSAIKGLKDALDNDPRVATNFSPIYVKKTYPAIQAFKGGNAIFTFPLGTIKCPGAPQKIMYLADDIFDKNDIRQKTTVMYNTALPFIFGVKKYAEQLMKVVQERNIQLNLRTNLVSVDHGKGEAVFEKLDQPGTFVTYKYDLLHAAPPMKPYDELKQSPIVDQNGYVDVDKYSLQHKKYPNIFAIGDCSNLPTSKTAAAVAAQSKILYENLSQVMQGKEAKVAKYDGYTSCPLTVGNGKLILAEFDYNGAPLETFPIDQGKKSRLFYYLKKDFMPDLYWYGLVKGIWNGPGFYRKLMRFGTN